jgi:hypothetical protein
MTRSNDASKLSLPLVLVLGALPIILSVGISYGVGTSQVSSIKSRVDDIEVKQQEIARISERLARVETKIDFLIEIRTNKAVSVATNP